MPVLLYSYVLYKELMGVGFSGDSCGLEGREKRM
jgi:hypothetical protein